MTCPGLATAVTMSWEVKPVVYFIKISNGILIFFSFSYNNNSSHILHLASIYSFNLYGILFVYQPTTGTKIPTSASETNLEAQAVAPPRMRRPVRRFERDVTLQSVDDDPAYSTDSNSTVAEDSDKAKTKKHKLSFPKFSRKSRQTPPPSKPTWDSGQLLHFRGSVNRSGWFGL